MKLRSIILLIISFLPMLSIYSKEYRCNTDERDFVLTSLRLNIKEGARIASNTTIDGYLSPKQKLFGIDFPGLSIVTSTLLDNKICTNPDGKYLCFNPKSFIKDSDGIILWLTYSDLFNLEIQLFDDEESPTTGFAAVIGRGENGNFFVDILECVITNK